MALIKFPLPSIGARLRKNPLIVGSVFIRKTSTSRRTNNEISQSAFIEKPLEDPIIVVSENDDVDIIGPPDSLSNLRPVTRKRLFRETDLQRELREMQNATQLWNQEFWATHNTNFNRKRQEYIDKHQVPGEETRQLSADEMSEFYKSFLDSNWKTHLKYNAEWYKKNFALLFLALRVGLEKNMYKTR
jgi:hypothetical protein